MIRSLTRELRWLVLLFLAFAVVACESDVDPTPLPNPDPVTETFSGSISANDAETHPFTSNRGAVTATLVTLTPDSTATVGFSLGTWNGLSCAIVLANDKSTQGTALLGSVNGTGSLCVRMYDVGTIGDAFAYEIRVVHF
jgi:hypothetical protein